MKKYKYIILLALLLFAVQAIAQPGPGNGRNMRERMKERIQTVKIWKLTEEVNLTSEQSEKFFPIYNEFQNKFMELEKKRFALMKELDDLAELSDVADEKLLEKMKMMESSRDDFEKLHNKFQQDVGDILSVRQQAKLLIFEEHFKRRIQETIDGIRREGKRWFPADREGK